MSRHNEVTEMSKVIVQSTLSNMNARLDETTHEPMAEFIVGLAEAIVNRIENPKKEQSVLLEEPAE